MPRRNQALDNFSANGREQRQFSGVLRRLVRITETKNAQILFAGLQVSLGLIAGRFGRFEITGSNCVMVVEVFGASVALLRQFISVLGLQMRGTKLRIIRTRDIEQRLAFVHCLSRRDDNPTHRATYLRQDRSGSESIEGHGTGQAKHPGQSSGLNRDDLNVGDLLLRYGEQLWVVAGVGRSGLRG